MKVQAGQTYVQLKKHIYLKWKSKLDRRMSSLKKHIYSKWKSKLDRRLSKLDGHVSVQAWSHQSFYLQVMDKQN